MRPAKDFSIIQLSNSRKAEDYEKLLGNYEDMDAFAEGYLRPYESLILKRK